jgi:hypothetical protein
MAVPRSNANRRVPRINPSRHYPSRGAETGTVFDPAPLTVELALMNDKEAGAVQYGRRFWPTAAATARFFDLRHHLAEQSALMPAGLVVPQRRIDDGGGDMMAARSRDQTKGGAGISRQLHGRRGVTSLAACAELQSPRTTRLVDPSHDRRTRRVGHPCACNATTIPSPLTPLASFETRKAIVAATSSTSTTRFAE